MRIIIPNSQLSPAHPTIQSQSYDPWVLMQVPLFWQGSSSHSFTSVQKNFKTGTWVSYKFNNFDYSYILILIYKNCFSQMSSWSGLYMWFFLLTIFKIKYSHDLLGYKIYYLLHNCILAIPLYRYMHRSHHYWYKSPYYDRESSHIHSHLEHKEKYFCFTYVVVNSFLYFI